MLTNTLKIKTTGPWDPFATVDNNKTSVSYSMKCKQPFPTILEVHS